jgi:hypothetical protein
MNRPSKYIGQHVLAKIPDDLKAMGWEWVPAESNAVTRWSRTWYKAVYVRPFDRNADNERAVAVRQYNRQWYVRVSTNQFHSASWEAAHEQAIELMRDADARGR